MNSMSIQSLSRSRSGGWSARVPMQQGQAQPSTGPQATFFDEMKKDEDGRPMPVACTFTVRFGISQPSANGNANLGAGCVAQARILSRVEGNQISRYIDVGHGTAITLTAESVDVSIFDATDTEALDAPPAGYSVTVTIAPGERASYLTPPTLRGVYASVDGTPTVGSGTVALAATTGTATYPLPQEAGIVSCEVVATDATTPSKVMSLVVQAQVGSTVLKQWNPFLTPGFVTLPPETTKLVVANLDADVADVTLTWGVEG